MPVQCTSIIALGSILNELNQRQIEVLKTIKVIQPCNNLQISNYLNLPINSITPRCQELRKKGIVIYHHTSACPITGRASNFYIIKGWIREVLC
jgi:hypothetical protein